MNIKRRLFTFLLVLPLLVGCTPDDSTSTTTLGGDSTTTTITTTSTGDADPTASTGESVSTTSTSADTVSGTTTRPSGGNTGVSDDMVEQVSYDQTAASFRVWDFNDTLDGFSVAGSGSSVKQSNSQLTFTCGNGGYLSTPSGLDIPAEAVRTVTFRLKSTKAKSLTLTWKRLDGGTDKATISLQADGKWHDYQIDLANVKSWKDTVDQLRFAVDGGQTVIIDWVRLTGVYLVPFPWLSGDFAKDAFRLKDIKAAWNAQNNTVTVGFSALVQYMVDTDENGNLAMSGMRSVEYLLKLAKAVDMPVMIWLRNDPWAEPVKGVAQELYADDNNLMWTEQLVKKPAYRKAWTGYYNFCLAQTDLNGKKTVYWEQTEKLLGQCAAEVAKAIEENPGYILGITTTSEYRYLTDGQEFILDYNPRTMKEFRDYCKQKYTTVAALNKACGTTFTTWELRSTDYDPTTVENEGGFDGPRTRFIPDAFWDVWTDFREQQLTIAEQKLVDIIGEHLDDCYIYTHQIAYDDHTTASPITTGNAEGSNIGIDFFNHEVNDENINVILEMLDDDVTRTWGVPEWLITHNASAANTNKALNKMLAAGVKYLCPFNWGSKDEYDVQGSVSEGALADYVARMEALVGNSLGSAKISATKGFAGGNALVDGQIDSVFTASSFSAGDWISFTFSAKRSLSSMTLIPASDGYYPETVSIQVDQNGKWVTVDTYNLKGASADQPLILHFKAVETTAIRLVVDKPATRGGAAAFTLAELKVG